MYGVECIENSAWSTHKKNSLNDLVEKDDLCQAVVLPQTEYNLDLRLCAESIAPSPPESHLDGEQVRALLASLLYLQEREANADRSQIYHSERENSVLSSSHFRKKCRETCRSVLTQKKVESRNVF